VSSCGEGLLGKSHVYVVVLLAHLKSFNL